MSLRMEYKTHKILKKLFKKSKKDNPDLSKAMELMEQFEFNKLIILYISTKVLYEHPDSYSVRCNRAYAYYWSEKMNLTLHDLDMAIQRYPKKPRTYALKGEA